MNKEKLQSYNTRLNSNNTNLDNVLDTINGLPEISGTLDIVENGEVDVTTYKKARVGVYTPPTLQDKEVTPSKETQNITSDEGYDGLNEVKVNPIPDTYIEPTGTLDITENGTYDVKEYEEATVNVAGSGGGGCLGQPHVVLHAYDFHLGKNTNKVQEITTPIYPSSYASIIQIPGENPDTVLFFWKTRSESTISNNVIKIYESDYYYNPDNTIKEKLYIGYIKNFNTSDIITITQEGSDNVYWGFLPLCNCGIPEVIRTDYRSNEASGGSVDIETDYYLNVYIVANQYTMKAKSNTNLPQIGRQNMYNDNIACFMASCPIENARISWDNIFYGCITQVRCPAKTN